MRSSCLFLFAIKIPQGNPLVFQYQVWRVGRGSLWDGEFGDREIGVGLRVGLRDWGNKGVWC